MLKNKIYFKFNYKDSSNKDIIKYFNKTLNETNNILLKKKFDASVILGDRYEMLAISLACFLSQNSNNAFFVVAVKHWDPQMIDIENISQRCLACIFLKLSIIKKTYLT